jgi:steroid 5-alpha reductase family enzyme
MEAEFLHLWLAALLFAVVLMALVWRLAIRLGNAGIVDIAWSAGFAPVVIFFALAGSGAPVRRALIAVMVSVWSLRLGGYLLVRVSAHHPQEDRRYARLRSEWRAGQSQNVRLFSTAGRAVGAAVGAVAAGVSESAAASATFGMGWLPAVDHRHLGRDARRPSDAALQG